MSTEQQLRLRRDLNCHLPSNMIRRSSPTVDARPQQHRGCCRGLAVMFSVLSDAHQPSNSTPPHQADDEMRGEVQRQRQLKAVYKARLERMQNYLRYCLEIAKENGFLDQISHNHQPSPPPVEIDRPISSNPHLEAIIAQAKLNGWFIEPHEVELHEKIGKGTTADIHKGTWRGLEVAVKWISPHFFQSNECACAWFAQELETLSRQRHPFVLRLLGACLLPPEYGWVVTELLSGKTLGEWLHGHKERRSERLISLSPLRERIEKGLRIAQALQYLHEQNPKVIHRDLKPSNILLDSSLNVRVADFGHARFLPDGEQALTGEIGTYVYMAPEVINCEPYNEKCDVYSFGIILNELITGQHPYIETNFCPAEIAGKVVEGSLRPKLPQNDGRYKELIDLICCSWHGDASNRPSFASITSVLRKIQEE